MHFKQFYLGCLAQASYLVGDEKTGTAVVVDPRRDIEIYLEYAEEHDLKIEHVMLTHFHADFLAGHIELRNRTGAELYIGAAGNTEFESTPMEDGETLELGNLRLQFLATPGHTPESTSIVIYDFAVDSDKPVSVLTGDTLFVGDVGRPDLLASIGLSARELGGMLYKSLHQKLMTLPDETLIYPAHGAGSLCGKSLGDENHSTIGAQRATNYALQPMEVEEFIQMVTADQTQAPPYFLYDATLNRKEHSLLEESLQSNLKPLSLEEVLHLQNSEAQILDCRHPSAYAASHLKNSLSIGLNGKFATWAGFVIDREKSIVLIAEPGEEKEALVRLGRIGYDEFVVGFLKGGIASVQARDDLLASFERVTVEEFDQLRAGSDDHVVIDVRGVGEWQTRAVEGNVSFPLQQLLARLDEIPRDRPLMLYCAGGYRSVIAASIIRRAGIENVTDLIGGFGAWAEAHPAVEAGN